MLDWLYFFVTLPIIAAASLTAWWAWAFLWLTEQLFRVVGVLLDAPPDEAEAVVGRWAKIRREIWP